jgi:hypothetical protein
VEALQQLAKERQKAGPVISALVVFLRLESDDQARELLLARASVLLSDDAGQALRRFKGKDAPSQARIDARRLLWEHVRLEWTAATAPPATPPATGN